MNYIEKSMGKSNARTILSTLWTVVMFNMIFADILSFMVPNFWKKIDKMQLNQVVLLIFAVLLEIPMIMIIFSKVLSYKVAKRANIVASIITILFVYFGGSFYLHYIFFAAIQTILMILIMIIARNWRMDASDPL